MVTKCIVLKKENTSGLGVGVIRMWTVMTLVSVFSLAFVMLVGCGEPNLENPKVREQILAQAIDVNTVETDEGPSGEELTYARNQNRPYTGWIKGRGADIFEFAAGGFLFQVQKGKINGPYISWYPNGQILEKGTLKDGEKNGVWTTWHGNGQKYEKGTFKNDERHGLWIQWDPYGEEVSREIY